MKGNKSFVFYYTSQFLDYIEVILAQEKKLQHL